MSKKERISRREFVQRTAIGAVAAAAWTHAPSIGVAGANSRINIGVIGLGSIAKSHGKAIQAIKDDENCDIAAVCDIWETRMNEYAAVVKTNFGEEPKKYHDYRELLANKEIDKVVIATPEHQHARMTIDACHAGKAIYCEKPMTHNSTEAIRVIDTINETGAIVQVGVQGMSDDSYESAHEVIKGGMLGQITQCQIDYVRRYDPEEGPWRTDAKTGDPKPDDLDWEAWLGLAWKRPWDARRYFDWRCYWDYSGGVSTDLFVHRITRIIKACGLREPVRGVGIGGIFKWDDGREVPDTFEMNLEYPGGPVVYCLGTMANDRGIEHCIRGYDATLVFENPGFNVYAMAGDQKGKVIHTHTRTGGEDQSLHHKNHHAAMRSGDKSLLKCPPELGFYGVLAVDLANESYKRKKYMTWDPEHKRVVPA
jgi:predicted dehydrogenase